MIAIDKEREIEERRKELARQAEERDKQAQRVSVFLDKKWFYGKRYAF